MPGGQPRGKRLDARRRARTNSGFPPHLLLLDLWLPDGDGLHLAKELRDSGARVRIIACTARSDDHALHQFDRLRLDGLVWKEAGLPRTLRPAILTVLGGGRYFPADLESARRRLRSDSRAWPKLLSDRELDLLPLLGRGMSDAEVAGEKGLSPHTVHSHRKAIMRKLGLHRSVELGWWAGRHGFVSPLGGNGEPSL